MASRTGTILLVGGTGVVGWYWWSHRGTTGPTITAPHSVPSAGGTEYLTVTKAGSLTPTLPPIPVNEPGVPGPYVPTNAVYNTAPIRGPVLSQYQGG